jgi:hypothetical protein
MEFFEPYTLSSEPITDAYILECLERKLKFQENEALRSEALIARETYALSKINAYIVGLKSDIARLKAKIEEAKG